MPHSQAFRDRYAAKLDKIIRRGERLTDAELRHLFKLVDATRKEVRQILINAPTDWQLVHYDTLQQRIEGLMAEMSQELGMQMRDLGGKRWDEGVELTDEMLSTFGRERELLGVPLDRTALSTLSDFSADLITDVPAKTIRNIDTALQLGIMGNKTPYEVMQDIGTRLVDESGKPAPGVWGDVMYRAEVIERTEGGRIHSVAQHSRGEQWNEERPGLKKTWKHGGAGVKQPRPEHVRAGIDYAPGGTPGPIPWDEPFIVGGEEMMHPRAAGASGENTINCHCTHGPYRDEWVGA
jgi:hypothetical protein